MSIVSRNLLLLPSNVGSTNDVGVEVAEVPPDEADTQVPLQGEAVSTGRALSGSDSSDNIDERPVSGTRPSQELPDV